MSDYLTVVCTFAFAFLGFPNLRDLIVFTFANSAVPQNAHAVIGPEATVTPQVDLEVTEKWGLHKLRKKWVKLLLVCSFHRCVVTTYSTEDHCKALLTVYRKARTGCNLDAYSSPELSQIAGTCQQLHDVDSKGPEMHYWAAVLSQALQCFCDCCPAACRIVAMCVFRHIRVSVRVAPVPHKSIQLGAADCVQDTVSNNRATRSWRNARIGPAAEG